MSFGQASNTLNLLGHQDALAAPDVSRSTGGPQFEVRWNSFQQGLGSSIRALLTGPSARKFLGGEFFRDCWVEGRVPRAAVTAAALWHIVFLVAPWPDLPATSRKNPALENFQLTWSGPINDFPPLKLSSAPAPAPATPSPRGDVAKPIAREGAEAFHPRQRIFTDPIAPTHPRQTLINTAARIVPPKILPSLPNIVLLQQSAVPAKPRMEMTEQMLAQLHPREHRTATVKASPLPDVPAVDGAPAEITLAPTANAPARPKLELNAGAAPRVAQQRSPPNDAGPAPELAHQNSMNSNASTLIALSATPGPVAPSAPPQGNLSARVAISPEGKQPGAPGGKPLLIENTNGGVGGTAENAGGSASGNKAGKNSTTVSISGGNPTPKNMSGLSVSPQPKTDSPTSQKLVTKIDPRARIAETPERTGPPNFAALPAGAKPEQIFAAKKMYTMLVNMPNLNSATGSWILNFSELRSSSFGPHVTPADLSGPSPIKKSDPRYPPTLVNEHVEGEVVLYAVIRADGSVDSVELVRGIDQQLDANAMEALSQWKFRPATRQGAPVDLEAIVHIPFHAPSGN
ncbi:MAG TPA: TonB family protein [Candidatus Acidoferrales bacterium]|nr:TonB family protein [Candidatus Acidoferrales bacterium]